MDLACQIPWIIAREQYEGAALRGVLYTISRSCIVLRRLLASWKLEEEKTMFLWEVVGDPSRAVGATARFLRDLSLRSVMFRIHLCSLCLPHLNI